VKSARLLTILPLFLLASCASDSGSSSTSSAPERKPMNERFSSGGRDPYSFQQDSNGKLKNNDSKRSSFENKGESNFASKEYGKKEYKAGDYTRKSFWGNKEYDRKNYAGDTDGSRFQTASRLQGKGAGEAGKDVKIPDTYQTGGYTTGDAREGGASDIRKNSVDSIENRRKVFMEPEVIGWKEQRGITLDQSRSILGR
jgi:hypothetical protein